MAPNRLMMYLRNLRYGPAFRRFNFFAFEFPVLEPWERFPHHSHGFLEFSISGVWDGETDLDPAPILYRVSWRRRKPQFVAAVLPVSRCQRSCCSPSPWCLMPNHWHLVLWPRRDGDLAAFVGWLSNTHVRRWRAHRHNSGQGHPYQGPYKRFTI